MKVEENQPGCLHKSPNILRKKHRGKDLRTGEFATVSHCHLVFCARRMSINSSPDQAPKVSFFRLYDVYSCLFMCLSLQTIAGPLN